MQGGDATMGVLGGGGGKRSPPGAPLSYAAAAPKAGDVVWVPVSADPFLVPGSRRRGPLRPFTMPVGPTYNPPATGEQGGMGLWGQ